MKNDLIEHSLAQFTVSGKTLIGEASEMENRHLEKIYDDACDVGFSVRLNSGNVVTFVMTEPFNTGEGEDVELAGWNYEPVSEDVRKFPECTGMTAKIFND